MTHANDQLLDLQSSLPKLAQTVLEGEWLVILFGGKKMVLHQSDDETAPPMREQGYFEDCMDDESIRGKGGSDDELESDDELFHGVEPLNDDFVNYVAKISLQSLASGNLKPMRIKA